MTSRQRMLAYWRPISRKHRRDQWYRLARRRSRDGRLVVAMLSPRSTKPPSLVARFEGAS